MTRWQRRANIAKWGMLALGVVLLGAGLFFVLAPLIYANASDIWGGLLWTPLLFIFGAAPDEPWKYAVDLALFLGVLLLLQWMFLRPSRKWTVRLTQSGRPMRTSVIAAAFVAMLISVGFVATLLEIPDWWDWVYRLDDSPEGFYLWPVWIAMGVLWFFWGVIFFLYWRQGDRYTQLGRMTRGLLAGSVLELLIATPVQAMTHQREDCYCARGSYTGLVFGCTALIWCFGPGVVLLFMRERYRAAAMHCAACNYDLRGSVVAGSTACPECGEPIKAKSEPSTRPG